MSGDSLSVVDERVGPEPRVGAHGELTDGAGAPHPGDELLDEPLVASLRRAFAEPGVQHLAGAGPAREDRVVAEDPRVAVGGALLLLAVHLTDRGVQVDRHRGLPRTGAE